MVVNQIIMLAVSVNQRAHDLCSVLANVSAHLYSTRYITVIELLDLSAIRNCHYVFCAPHFMLLGLRAEHSVRNDVTVFWKDCAATMCR